MKTRTITLFAMLALISCAPQEYTDETQTAAHPEEEAILASIQLFFDGLAGRDASKIGQAVFADGNAISVRYSEGKQIINTRQNSTIPQQIASSDSPMLERIWEPVVMVSGDIAMVWAPYDFYVDTAFSHCGIDIFSMLKTEKGWKIADVLYTVERENCEESPLGKPDF